MDLGCAGTECGSDVKVEKGGVGNGKLKWEDEGRWALEVEYIMRYIREDVGANGYER